MPIYSPQTITNANVIIDGIGELGTTKSVTLPKVEEEMYTQKFGGGTRHVPTGMYKEMTTEITLERFSPTVYKAMLVKTAVDLIVIIKADVHDQGKTVQFNAIVKGIIQVVDDGAIEAGKQVERKITIATNFYALEVDGKQGYVIDVENLITEVDGRDILEQLREAVGV